MNSHRILGNMVSSRSFRPASFLLATLCLGIIYFVTTAIVARSAQQSPNSVFLDAPAAIYAPDPNDSWNKIFFYLFSRRVETRVTDEFPNLAKPPLSLVQKIHGSSCFLRPSVSVTAPSLATKSATAPSIPCIRRFSGRRELRQF